MGLIGWASAQRPDQRKSKRNLANQRDVQLLKIIYIPYIICFHKTEGLFPFSRTFRETQIGTAKDRYRGGRCSSESGLASLGAGQRRIT